MSKESKLKPQWNSTTKPTEWLKWEETDQTKCSQNVDNRNSHTLFLGIILENYLAKPTKAKKAHILLSTNSSPSHILSKTGDIRLTKVIHKKVLTTLFVVASNWKPLKMTTSHIDKYILIYSYNGYYVTVRVNKLLLHKWTWMDLTNIEQRKSYTKDDITVLFYLYKAQNRQN